MAWTYTMSLVKSPSHKGCYICEFLMVPVAVKQEQGVTVGIEHTLDTSILASLLIICTQ